MKQVKIFQAIDKDAEATAWAIEKALNIWLARVQQEGATDFLFHPTHAETGANNGECSVTVYTVLVEYETAI